MNAATARAPASTEPTSDPALITDPGITGVMIQFFSSNSGLFPPRFYQGHDAPKKSHRTPPNQIVRDTKNVAIVTIYDDLVKAGFVLANGFYFSREPSEDAEFPKILHVMRFQFFPARTHKFESEKERRLAEEDLLPLFLCLAKDSYWQVAAYNNAMNSGGSAIGIKCSNRFMIKNPDGTSLTRKPRDSNGKPCGEPEPFVPDASGKLNVVDGRLLLV